MKPIIGIITRPSTSKKGHKISIVYNDIYNAIKSSGGIPVGIFNDNFMDYINICNGFILQGGDEIEENDLKIIRYLYDNNIPLLGICLGMQEMAVALNGKLRDTNNHNIKSLHEIVIKKNTKLYNIINATRLTVNSRHTSAVKKTKLKVSARASDGIVEAIEDSDKTFFIGLEWHPENLYKIDISSKKIVDYFIDVCNH